MNAAHLHITLVHIPVVLLSLGFILLAWGIAKHNISVARVSLFVFIVSSVVVVPAFLMGGEAEEIVEHLAGVSEDLIEAHEEVGEVAFWLTLALGLMSLLAWYVVNIGAAIESLVLKVTLLLSLVASGALMYTAYKGGKIRHPEAYEMARKESAGHTDEGQR